MTPRRPYVQAGGLLVVAGVVFGTSVGRPSPWRDEVATLASSRVSIPSIVRDSRTLDAVHTAYYLLVHVAGNGADDVLVGRWISVVCLAVTVALVSLIGSALGSRRVGLLAGSVLIVSPLASRFAEEARPFALATMLAAAASLALVRAIGGTRRPTARWVAYGVLLAATGLANVLAMSVAAAHLAHVAVADRRRLVPWAAATLGALAVLSPFLRLASHQSGQIGSLARPGLSVLVAFMATALGSAAGLAIVAAIVVVAAVVAARRSPRAEPEDLGAGRRRGGWVGPGRRRGGWALAGTWGVLIPVGYFAVSQVHPLFATRYLIFCLPGLALVVAACLAQLPMPAAVATLLVVAACGIPHQLAERGPGGHGENIVALDAAVAEHQLPGTAVVFLPWSVRRVAQLDPELWRALRDPVLQDPADTTALFAARVTTGVAVRRLDAARHVIVIRKTSSSGTAVDAEDRAVLAAVDRQFVLRRSTEVTGFAVQFLDAAPGG